MLAMNWAEDKAPPELQQFDFMFLIALRDVEQDIPLEEVIIKQHQRLKVMKIPKEKVKLILDGATRSRVLLLLDGYDEYKKGTNTNIDDAISDTVGDCFILITSRPGDYMDKDDCDQMDGTIQIIGFSRQSIKECASKYLESKNKADELMKQTDKTDISELLRIPIILLMVCFLYYQNHALPSTKTDIVKKIIWMLIDRATLKHFGKKADETPNLEEMLNGLGQLSHEASQRYAKQLLIKKVRHMCNLISWNLVD